LSSFIRKILFPTGSRCCYRKAQVLRSYEHTEAPKMNYQNRNHLTLLVTETTNWLELEKKLQLRNLQFLSRTDTRVLYFNTVGKSLHVTTNRYHRDRGLPHFAWNSKVCFNETSHKQRNCRGGPINLFGTPHLISMVSFICG
jgi:hypothetical protein